MNDRRITQIRGRGLPLRGNDIDTDRIIPARFLKAITFEGLEAHLFEDERKGGGHPLDAPAYQGARVLLVNANFGCGSSREHAPQAIWRWGIEAIVGESYSDIFFGNAAALGLPCVTAAPDAVASLMSAVEVEPTTELVVDLECLTATAGGAGHAISLPPAVREAFMSGQWDATGLLLDRYEEVEAVARRLPYLQRF